MTHHPKAFTLVEMLMVLIIVAILMTIIMAFGGDVIRDIQARKIREEWVADYTMMRGSLLLSSYSDGMSISGVLLTFENGSMIQTVTTKESLSSSHTYAYSGMSIVGPSTPISLVPYLLSCDSSPSSQHTQSNKTSSKTSHIERVIRLEFDHSDKHYCYSVDPHTCKISRLSQCPSVE